MKNAIQPNDEMDRETFRNVIRRRQVNQRLGQQLMHSLKEFGILILMVILMGVMFEWQEDWKLLDSVYFVFTTASTIGFGDFSKFYPVMDPSKNVSSEECEKYRCEPEWINVSNSMVCKNCKLSDTGKVCTCQETKIC